MPIPTTDSGLRYNAMISQSLQGDSPDSGSSKQESEQVSIVANPLPGDCSSASACEHPLAAACSTLDGNADYDSDSSSWTSHSTSYGSGDALAVQPPADRVRYKNGTAVKDKFRNMRLKLKNKISFSDADLTPDRDQASTDWTSRPNSFTVTHEFLSSPLSGDPPKTVELSRPKLKRISRTKRLYRSALRKSDKVYGGLPPPLCTSRCISIICVYCLNFLSSFFFPRGPHMPRFATRLFYDGCQFHR